MRLSARLEAVLGLIPRGYPLLDVGCDHAFLSVEAVRRGICPCAVASDIGRGPLRSAAAHIREAGLSDLAAPVLADGIPGDWRERTAELLGIPEEEVPAPAAVTAGMGGILMTDIYRRAADFPETISVCVASPQRDADLFRRFLVSGGLWIEAETFVEEDGKFYPVIRAVFKPGERQMLLPAEEKYGPLILKERSPAFLRYLTGRRLELSRALSCVPEDKTRRREEIGSELRVIESVLDGERMQG